MAEQAGGEWRRMLRPLVRADDEADALTEGAPPTAAPPPGAGRRTPLGVQFEVREVTRRGRGRWQHTSNTTVAATVDSVGPLRLTVRPVMPGRQSAGDGETNWVGANLAWTGLQYQVHQLGLDPGQVRWFTEFAALARAQSGSFVGQDGVRIALDDFGSALLWPLLAESRALGITLVGPGREPLLQIGRTAEVRLEAEADAASGAVELTPVVAIDGLDITGHLLGRIGEHGLYAIEWRPGRTSPAVRLAPGARPLGREVLALATAGPIRVPAPERDEFFADYYPDLARAVPIVSTDASLELPAPPPVTPPAAVQPTAADEPEAGGESPFTDDYVDATPELTVTLVPSDDRDWLNLGFVVRVDGREVPFAKLFSALVKGRSSLKLVDGSRLRLNQPVFAQLLDLIAEADTLTEWQPEGIRLHRTQLDLWREFEDLADESEAAVEWRRQVAALASEGGAADAVGLEPPAGLTAELREYQREGYAWLARLYDHGLGGILADDMGLGKTVQTLALILRSQASAAPQPSGREAPWLVVAPASVVSNWVDEAAKFAPGLRVASVTRTQLREPRKLAELAAMHDVIVMSYNLFRLDFDDVEDIVWAGLVLDEAQFVKNHRSRAHECAKALPAPFKLAITGTPMENNVLELWAILDIVAPGLFPSVRRFTEQYVRPLTHVREAGTVPAGISPADASRVIGRLRRRVRPFLLRRTKALVAPELPDKQEQVIRVELAPKHRRLYEQYLQRERQKLLGLVHEEFDRQRFILFRSITLLRMLALDAALIDSAHEGVPSAKLEALLEQLGDVVAEGHRSLVFSQFTSYLRRVAGRLEAAGIRYEYLDGATVNRAEVIARFKRGDVPVFLISLKAGGFGLNLTEADYVFLLDPWWNPAAEAQAVDRTHRLGQESKVNVYRLVADGTIEDKVMKLRDEKAELFDQVLDDDGAFSQTLTADDIRGLLEL